MTTLKDIAREAGVSVMTVSNVVNGNFSKVSAATIDKVNQLIKKYNYTPNAVARSLSAKSSKIIVMCIPGGHEGSLLQSPYNSSIVSIIEQFVYKKEHYLMINSASDIDQILSNLKMWNADGAFFLGVSDQDIKYLDENVPVPFVCIDSYHNSEKVISIVSDDFKGGYLAGKHLVSKGHKQIAFATSEEIESNSFESNKLLKNRYAGFKKALNESGLELQSNHIFGCDISYEGGLSIGKKIAAKRSITAVMATADILSAGIMEGAKLGGLDVPSELSVTGYDDLPLCSYITPKLTTIHQNIQLKGKLAAKYLFDLIEANPIEDSHVLLDVKLIERESVNSLT